MVEVFVKSAYVIEIFFVFPNIYLAAKLNPREKSKIWSSAKINPREKFLIWPSEILNARENKPTRILIHFRYKQLGGAIVFLKRNKNFHHLSLS